MQGRIHSIETLGLLDGPGIRTLFFLQGCPLRCTYCHNPDSQGCGGQLMTPQAVLETALRYRPYYTASGGGVTFTGGEPLMQGAFLVECLQLLKAHGIHTAVDTSGFGQEAWFPQVLALADCVLLDVKAVNEADHVALTGRSLQGRTPFWKALTHFTGQLWVRHVMVPGYTDSPKAMEALYRTLQTIPCAIEKFEILPYHKKGSEKYSRLNREDPLAAVPPMDPAVAKALEQTVIERLKAPGRTQERRVS